jgi:hypothetical protein
MSYCILLRIDSNGCAPVLLREDEELPGVDGVRYRFVAEADTLDEANAILQQLSKRTESRPEAAG